MQFLRESYNNHFYVKMKACNKSLTDSSTQQVMRCVELCLLSALACEKYNKPQFVLDYCFNAGLIAPGMIHTEFI